MTYRDLDDVELRALAFVDERELVRDLVDLVAVPSVSGSDAESDVVHQLAKRLQLLDLDLDLWELDLESLTADPAFPGWEVPRSEAWGLVATGGPAGDRPALVLQGHVDVVPPGDLGQWRGDPFVPRVAGGRVHGRGTVDMKAGVVASIAAVRAVRAAGIPLSRPYALHLVVGEEDGGLGAFGTLARGHRGDACIIAEPTSGTLTSANAGALTFEITVPGLATHGSTAYAGVSAFEAFLPVHVALTGLQERRNQHVDPLMREYPVAYPLSIGRVTCGDWASSVPDRLRGRRPAGGRDRRGPGTRPRGAGGGGRRVARSDPWLRGHPPVVTWPGGQLASGRYAGDRGGLRGLIARAHADVTGGVHRASAARRTAATSGCTPVPASPRCTTDPVTSAWPTDPGVRAGRGAGRRRRGTHARPRPRVWLM